MQSKRTMVKIYWSTGRVAYHKNIFGNLLQQILLRQNSHVCCVFIRAMPKTAKLDFAFIIWSFFPLIRLSPQPDSATLNQLSMEISMKHTGTCWAAMPGAEHLCNNSHPPAAGMPFKRAKWQYPIWLMGSLTQVWNERPYQLLKNITFH